MCLSERMNCILKMINVCDTVADIGTDHAYIPIYIIKNHIAKKVIASDVNSSPLKIAKFNIDDYQYGDFIETRLGCGLSTIKPYEVDSAVISGMGGMLIVNILNKSIETVKTLKQIVLQPQGNMFAVRKYIHSIGFRIEDEEIIKDYGKYYNIISVVKGNEVYDDEMYYFIGKCLMDKKTPMFRSYVEHMICKINNILKNIYNNKSESCINRKLELKKEQDMYKEALKCL